MNWLQALPMAELAINSAVSDSTGMSPAFVVYGRSVRLPVDLLDGVQPVQHAQDTVDNWVTLRDTVSRKLLAA